MEKHLDTMGFLLAAIVISVTLLSDREAKRSERQFDRIHDIQVQMRELLGRGQTVSPSIVTEWVARARAEADRIIAYAHVLNVTLAVIVIGVGISALYLLGEGAERPDGAYLLVGALMLGAAVSALYGELAAFEARRQARKRFDQSDLGLFDRVSTALRPRIRSRKISKWRKAPPPKFEPDALRTQQEMDVVGDLINQVEERYPDWSLVSELRAMRFLAAGRHDEAADALKLDDTGDQDYNLPVLLTAAKLRANKLDEVLPILDGMATRRGTDRTVDELRFDLGLATAHRNQLFTSKREYWADQLGANESLEFDVSLGDVAETTRLRQLGRAWTDPKAGETWSPSDEQGLERLPLSWVWQVVHGSDPAGGWEAVDLWRERQVDAEGKTIREGTQDAAALESLGFACLATGGEERLDKAVELFENAALRDSKSGATHWGLALAYFQRNWYDKATTSLNRARICDFSAALCEITEEWFRKSKKAKHRPVHFDFKGDVQHKFPHEVTLEEIVALSLLGIEGPIDSDGTPRNRFAMKFAEAARRTVP